LYYLHFSSNSAIIDYIEQPNPNTLEQAEQQLLIGKENCDKLVMEGGTTARAMNRKSVLSLII